MTKSTVFLLSLSVAFGSSSTLAQSPSPVFNSLPPELKVKLEQYRKECRELAKSVDDEKNPIYNKTGDEGLLPFKVNGARGVVVDSLHVCGDGQECHKGVNCATGYVHTVEVYVDINGWKKVFGEEVTEPIHLSIDRASGELKFMAFKIPGWDDAKCKVPPHIKRKHGPTSWKAYACDYLLKWKNNRFAYERM